MRVSKDGPFSLMARDGASVPVLTFVSCRGRCLVAHAGLTQVLTITLP